ncbi:MAG: choice-of-anchor A family protein [Reinekea sp.]
MKHSILKTGLLATHNLILHNDYNYQGGDVEGATFVGGDLNTSGQASDFGSKFGTKVNANNAALSVVGDVNGSTTWNGQTIYGDIHVQHGDFVYGGALNANPIMNGGGAVYQDKSLSIANIWNELTQASTDTLNAITSNQKELTYTGSDAVAVFNYSADDLFAQNTSLMLNAGSADTVVINVSGKAIKAGGGTNLVNGFNHNGIGAANILWNFYEAESVDFNNLAMWGAILAVDADLTGGAVFDGSVAALSYTGAREFHKFDFNPPVEVSEPGALALFALGLIAMIRRRKIA